MSLPRDPESVTHEVGFSAIPNWLLRDPAVDTTAKLVYLLLSGRVGKDYVCWPSQARLASEAGVSVPTVKRALTRLRRLGVIQVRTEVTDRGRRNSYRLLVHPFR